MLNPLRFTKLASLPRPESSGALLIAAAGEIAPRTTTVPAAATANLGRLTAGLDLQLQVLTAGLGRLRPPPPAPVTLQDRIREARHRLASGTLATRQTKLLAVRQAAVTLSAVLTSNG